MARSPLPGGGPWRILASCPGLLHNTQNAAVKGMAELQCVCPRALVLRESYLEARRVAIDPGLGRNAPGTSVYIASVKPGIRAPALEGGACFSPLGQDIADRIGRQGGVALHREMCEGCPVKAQCLDWALTAEQPGGAWGGMYGGLTSGERKQAWKRRREAEKVRAA